MISETSSSPADTHEERLGHRPHLTTWDAIAQSLAIGPIFSVAFVFYLIASSARGAAPLATLIGTLGALAIGWVITLYARRYAGAGAIYDYLRRINPVLGLFGAACYFTGSLLYCAAGYLALGYLVANIFQNAGATVPVWIGALVAALIILGINHLGIRIATRTQLILSILAAIPLLVLAIVIIIHGGARGNTLLAFSPTLVPPSALFGGLLFAISLFIGFETSASLGEETLNPKRSIPWAVLGTILVSAVFYLLMIYAIDIGLGIDRASQWSIGTVFTLAGSYVGKPLVIFISFAVTFDLLVVTSAFTATTARGWFSLARHGLAPTVLTHQSRRGTPLGGNLFTFLVGLLPILAIALFPLPPSFFFNFLAAIASMLIEIIYVLLVVVASRWLAKERTQWWQWIVLITAFIAPILALIGSSWPLSPATIGASIALILAGTWAILARQYKPQQLVAAAKAYSWEKEQDRTSL